MSGPQLVLALLPRRDFRTILSSGAAVFAVKLDHLAGGASSVSLQSWGEVLRLSAVPEIGIISNTHYL